MNSWLPTLGMPRGRGRDAIQMGPSKCTYLLIILTSHC